MPVSILAQPESQAQSEACHDTVGRTRTLQFADTTSRGRNGWFRVRTATLCVPPDGRLQLWVYSKRTGGMPPVVLDMDPEDARRLAAFLLGKASA